MLMARVFRIINFSPGYFAGFFGKITFVLASIQFTSLTIRIFNTFLLRGNDSCFDRTSGPGRDRGLI